MSLFDLGGKVAVVTGATKGIGLGIARELVRHGASVVVSSRDQALCDQVAQAFNTEFGRGGVVARGAACDIDSLDDIERFAATAREAFGGVDILVCNAAALPFIGPSADTPPEAFERVLSTNIHHNFRLCQALRGSMAVRGGGSIVLIGSQAGHAPSPSVLAYGVAKAGVAHMALSLADEMAAENIRVNCVAPGLIRSFSSQPLWRDAATLRSVAQAIPLGRIGEPEDIAGAVIFLVSAAGAFVTGETILVDGGRNRLSPPRTGPTALEAAADTLNARHHEPGPAS